MRRYLILTSSIFLSLTCAAPAFAAVLHPVAPPKMTAWSMFMGADWVVKSVMLILVIASIITWAICVARYSEFRTVLRAVKADQEKLASASGLNSVPPLESPISSMILKTARDEVEDSSDLGNQRCAEAVTQRVSIRLMAAEAEVVQSMRTGFSFLASIGATAPFIGLFGTVWGIMNSFIGISQARTTNLAVVAPGIAEALLATALGLVAAVPAVLLYNMFSRKMAGFRRHLHGITANVACLVSRATEQAQAAHLKIAV